MAYGCIWSKRIFSWLWWEGHWKRVYWQQNSEKMDNTDNTMTQMHIAHVQQVLSLVIEPILGPFPRDTPFQIFTTRGFLQFAIDNVWCKNIMHIQQGSLTRNVEHLQPWKQIQFKNWTCKWIVSSCDSQSSDSPLSRGYVQTLSLCFRTREISFLPGYIQIALAVTTGTYCMRFSQGPISTHSWTKSWKQVHHVGKKSDPYNHYQKSPSVKAAHNFHRNWVSLPQNDPQCSPKPWFAIFCCN